MGRSVSKPRDTVVSVYEDVSSFGYCPSVNEDGEEINPDNPELWEYDENVAYYDWEDYKEYLKTKIEKVFPSMVSCDKWIDDEDFALMENNFAYVGISEYCGCVCLWLSSKEEELLNTGYSYDASTAGLAKAWTRKVKDKFYENFGTHKRVGGFSDGTSVYEKK